MIPLVVRRFFPTPHVENKLELSRDVNAVIDVKAQASYDFLGNIDKPMVEDESYHLYSSLDAQHSSAC